MEEPLLEATYPFSRRQLLPWWIKVFCWLFMLMGAIIPFAFVIAPFGFEANLALYGMATHQPLSLIGILIAILIAFKGFTAYALWFEKDYAILLGKVDAVIGMVTCVIIMLVMPIIGEGFVFTFRLEIIPLVLFYQKLDQITYDWVNQEKQSNLTP